MRIINKNDIMIRSKKMKMLNKLAGAIGLLIFAAFTTAATAQTRTLSLTEAVQLGIQNSKQLKRSQYKINEELARLDQTKDAYLPTAKVGFQYLHALMLTRTVNIPGLTDAGKPLQLPFDFPAYIGTLSVSEPIFNGNQLKYAKQSADLLVQLSRLDADKDKEDVTYLIISSYINYNKILQNQQIVAQNIQDVQSKLDEITKYEGQGLATQNDVLRFPVAKDRRYSCNGGVELENNLKDCELRYEYHVGFAGFDGVAIIGAASLPTGRAPGFCRSSFSRRRPTAGNYRSCPTRTSWPDINVKKDTEISAQPTVIGESMGAYYINPTGKAHPDR